jgi:hypothetical protein
LLGRYDYPTRFRVFEVASLLVFGVFAVWFAWRIGAALLGGAGAAVLPGALVAAVAAYLTADFLSGLVHFLCDTLGSPSTPIVGQKFIKAFREHHDDPEAMTLGDFVEVNADNFFVCLPVLVPCTLWLDVEAHLHLSVYLAVLIAFVTVTNELHKRAHLPAARGPLGVLQRSRLVLAPGHHGVHHTPPHDGYYCITAGVLNPVLARLRFWPALRRLCAVPAALPPAR